MNQIRIGILLCLSFYAVSVFSQSDVVLYSFFVAGHTYGKPGTNNIGFYPPFKNKFDYINSRSDIQFGVLTGDIVSANPTAQDWDEIDADLELLDMPVYFVAGNHDMEDRGLYEERYGLTYYHFLFQNDLFIVLDPNLDSWNISGEQLDYLTELLDELAFDIENIYVFFHQVLWWEGDNKYASITMNSSSGRADEINFWTEVEPLFHSLPNRVSFFAGDLGAGSWADDVAYDSYDNISLIASGMGGNFGDNFIVVKVLANKTLEYDLICLDEADVDCLGELTDYQISELNEQKIKWYPNPVSTQLTIELQPEEQTTIRLYDYSGQLILDELSERKFKFEMDVSGVAPGVYFLSIHTSENVQRSKLMIK